MDTRERSRHANWLIWSPAALALAALPSCAQGSRLWMASHRHDGAGTGNRRPAARRTGPDDVVFEQQPARNRPYSGPYSGTNQPITDPRPAFLTP